MHHRYRPLLVALLSVFALATWVMAGLPIFWTLESQPEFLTGEVDGLSIAHDGVISLAPATQSLYESTDPFFWSLVSDREGNLYAGSGNNGKVYKIDREGKARVLVDTAELEVHGLALDRQGQVYVATSPRGRVYKVSPDGEQQVFFDPDDRYIWALAFDPVGNLLVATGDKGYLYRVSPSGDSEVLFASQETHLMCLATDADGNIYAGSDSNGLVFKIDSGDRVSVLFDTPFREVRALVVDAAGNVFAATINDVKGPTAPPAPGAPTATTPPQTAPAKGMTESVTVTVSASPMLAAVTPTAGVTGLRGAVYRIGPEGSAERLWASAEDVPLSLKLERDDRVMVGTGKKGRIFLVRQDKTSSLLLRAEADQVTSIYSTDGRNVFFATSNPAKLYRFGTRRRPEGEYRSPSKDTETVSSWGMVRWEGRSPTGTGVVIQTRTGNSSKPDNTWSDWSPPYTISDGEQIASPKGPLPSMAGDLEDFRQRRNAGATEAHRGVPPAKPEPRGDGHYCPPSGSNIPETSGHHRRHGHSGPQRPARHSRDAGDWSSGQYQPVWRLQPTSDRIQSELLQKGIPDRGLDRHRSQQRYLEL